jgi:hypothetical protein
MLICSETWRTTEYLSTFSKNNRFTMTRFILFSAALLAAFPAVSQGLSTCQEVIGITGKSATESGLYYAYTVGEPVVMTLKKQGINTVLTQGFHQPDICLPVTAIHPELWTGWDIQVYPNPVSQWLTVQFTAPDTQDLTAQVISTDGKIVIDNALVTSSGKQIDVSTLLAGLYYLQLRDPVSGAVSSVQFFKSGY